MAKWLQRLALTLGALVLCGLFTELAGRMLHFDFSGQLRAQNRCPIYYRQSTRLLPPIFFHREGPAHWTGRPLSEASALSGIQGSPYPDERVITATYDAEGFRNPPDLNSWEVAVVGDSFIEAGYLPDEQLMTTRLAELYGAPVKNLGCSYTGPLSYLAYMKAFGLPMGTSGSRSGGDAVDSSSGGRAEGSIPSVRHAMLVFFEGNDVTDLIREAEQLTRYRVTKVAPSRAIVPRTSSLRWVGGLFERNTTARTPRASGAYRNAYFRPLGVGATEIPVSVASHPPWASQLNAGHRELLEGMMAQWELGCRSRGIKPWIVYMPCKRRVLDGQLRFVDGVEPVVREWRPTDLPAYMETLAHRHGVAFLDLTPALRAEALTGRMTFNPVWDTHLNAHGSEVAARVLAEALAAADRNWD